jgi:hypothetical protein
LSGSELGELVKKCQKFGEDVIHCIPSIWQTIIVNECKVETRNALKNFKEKAESIDNPGYDENVLLARLNEL